MGRVVQHAVGIDHVKALIRKAEMLGIFLLKNPR